MKKFVFDVDGVMTDIGEPIDQTFKQWFMEWASDKSIYFVTGGTHDRIIHQLGYDLATMAEIAFCCQGNSIWFKDQPESLINQFKLSEEETQWLETTIRESNYPIKTGNHIEMRPGSCNFSVLGKNASHEERMQYMIWDRVHKERESIITRFTEQFDRFQAYIGGMVSIDICLRSANKGQVISLLGNRQELYFFADRCGPYEIDRPLCDQIGNSIEIKYGYKELWERLKAL